MSDKSCPHDRGDIWLSGDGVYTSKRSNPTCVFCPKDSMTPSEKKARESLLSEAQALTLDWTRHKHLDGYPRLDERIALALDIAEHRGFMAGFQAHKDMIEANRA